MSLAHRAAAVAALAAAGLLVPATSWAEPARPGGPAICTDGDMSLFAWQTLDATQTTRTIPGTIGINANAGDKGPKNADFNWVNKTTGVSGYAEGWGHGAGGASALMVVTGAGQVEITADYTLKDLNQNPIGSAHCVGTVTVV